MNNQQVTILERVFQDWRKRNRGLPPDAYDDLRQDFFVRVLELRRDNKLVGKVRKLSYFYTILTNICLYKQRRHAERASIAAIWYSPNVDRADLDDGQLYADFFADLPSLSGEDRHIVGAGLDRQQTRKSVAVFLGISKKSVESAESRICCTYSIDSP